jgi:hypothetical protein
MIRTGVQITDGIQVRVNIDLPTSYFARNQTGCVPGHQKHTPGQKHRQTQTQEAGFMTDTVLMKHCLSTVFILPEVETVFILPEVEGGKTI